jgi:hypothetical protein
VFFAQTPSCSTVIQCPENRSVDEFVIVSKADVGLRFQRPGFREVTEEMTLQTLFWSMLEDTPEKVNGLYNFWTLCLKNVAVWIDHVEKR